MTNEEILKNVPSGATHYASEQYIRDDGDRWNFYRKTTGWNSALIKDSIDNIRSLDDIRRIVELEKERDLIYSGFYNIVRIGTWFAVSNKCVPTCEADADGYSLNLFEALKQAEKVGE